MTNGHEIWDAHSLAVSKVNKENPNRDVYSFEDTFDACLSAVTTIQTYDRKRKPGRSHGARNKKYETQRILITNSRVTSLLSDRNVIFGIDGYDCEYTYPLKSEDTNLRKSV